MVTIFHTSYISEILVSRFSHLEFLRLFNVAKHLRRVPTPHLPHWGQNETPQYIESTRVGLGNNRQVSIFDWNRLISNNRH